MNITEMDIMHSCRCCLRCPPDKDLTAPYVHHGKTEVYVDMLKDCFDIQLTLNGPGSCGICSACVGRLRDARDFKLQVQRSEAELQGALLVKAEPLEPVVKSELVDAAQDDSVFAASYEVTIDTPGVEDEARRVSDEDPLMMCETSYNRKIHNISKADSNIPATVQAGTAGIATKTCRIGRHMYKLRPQDSSQQKNTSNTFQCHDCGRSFTKRNLLQKHIKKVHTGDTHKCTYCHYNYKHKSALKEHERTHTGEKPFRCNYCDYRTRHNSNLKTHIMIHTGEKPMSCDSCEYKCRRETELKKHKRTHTKEKPYECSYCNYKCSDPTHLRTHEMAHRGEKPVKCRFCDYKCRRRSDMKVHQTIHTGEKPLKCSLCEYTCRHRNSLRLHIKAKHPGDNP